MKASVKRDLEDELKAKKSTFDGHIARTHGNNKMLPIDVELRIIQRKVKMTELEVENDTPLRPNYAFEQNEEWRVLRRSIAEENLEQMKNTLGMVLHQKQTIETELPELKARINEIEGLLGRELSKWD